MSKIEKILLFLLIIFLPSQLGYHFWPDWSLVNGIRVDHLSPTVYLTDILIGLLILIKGSKLKVQGSIIIFVVLNTLAATNPLLAGYRWLRVYEYYWLYKYLVNSIQYSIFNIQLGLKIALIWTAALAWIQFLHQRSVGGWLYWLGERSFSVSTPGIAKVFIPHLGFILRPYSVLPHPNALAGWLLVAGLMVGGWPLIISLITIPITFSRSVILLLPTFLWRKSKMATIFLFSFLLALFSNLGNPNSFSERQILITQSLQVINQHFWLGVGLGNFIYHVPTIRQPVHNIYLLLASELGMPALIVLGYWLIVNSKKLLLPAVAVIIITGVTDHYWLTLHQNLLLLVILLAYGNSHQYRRGI